MVFYSYFACFVNTFYLKYVHVHVIHRVNQADYLIHILVVAPQQYVKIYSTRGSRTSCSPSRITRNSSAPFQPPER